MQQELEQRVEETAVQRSPRLDVRLNPQITFDKEQIFGYSDLEFVGPGHPLFEGCRFSFPIGAEPCHDPSLDPSHIAAARSWLAY